jgi:hypothetical protein
MRIEMGSSRSSQAEEVAEAVEIFEEMFGGYHKKVYLCKQRMESSKRK